MRISDWSSDVCSSDLLLHHVVVRLRPVPGALQAPAVKDVADQVERLAVGVLQKVEQVVRLAAPRAKVDVGDEDCAEPGGGGAERYKAIHRKPLAGDRKEH